MLHSLNGIESFTKWCRASQRRPLSRRAPRAPGHLDGPGEPDVVLDLPALHPEPLLDRTPALDPDHV